jgi:hypothetical protein
MTRTRSARSAITIIISLGLWLGANAALAQNSWNQARVTGIAEQLAERVQELKLALDREPPDLSFSQRRAQYELREDLRLLRNSTQHLASELKAGKGREETRPVFRRIQNVRRDAEENARKTLIPGELMDKILETGAVLLQIEPYYREEATE